MKNSKSKLQKRLIRHKRVRARIYGTARIPRLCVFRSGNHIYAQLIDDEKGVTLAAVSDKGLKLKAKSENRKIAAASEVGRLIAERAKYMKIEKIVFDRGGYRYHGRVKSLAQGAREGGIKF